MNRKLQKSGRMRKRFALVLAFTLFCQNLGLTGGAETVKASDAKIDLSTCEISAKNASGHEAAKAIDGDTATYWQSIPSDGEGSDARKNRMYDHNRYIDITLDGTYELSQIKIFNNADGSFNNYYVYASADGVNYDKIISKTSDAAATGEGDTYPLANVSASYLRLNMAYNSDRFVTNLAELEVYGSKTGDAVPEPEPISVEDWEGSDWQIEWDKFEANENGYADRKVINEMGNLVGRVIGDKWKDSFQFELRDSLEEGKDIFEIKDGADGKIVIRGNSGVAMASGFNYYLKNYVNVDYNPMYSSNTNMKAIQPVGKRIIKEAQFDLRYALNFCTYSYTMSFWNWDEYEQFIDWAAMNGINLILDIVGQEEVLRQTFREFDFTDEEIKDYICGPAYFAWFYMQNLYSIGGPLPDSWFEGRVELGRQIHDRMQTYGIDPVIQAFAGQVPDSFVEKNPKAVFAPDCDWSGFTRPSIIKTYLTDQDRAAGKEDYYSQVADVFYAKQKNVFGNVSHYYATDPFHEGGATGNLNVSEIYKAVQDKMLEHDKDAVWVMQQWQGNLDAKKMSQLDTSKTRPLDLQADMNPKHGLFEENGSQWIYCMLHNFGGRMGVDGDIPKMASDPIETYQMSKNMVGIGMTPEAMENSPVVYELLFETTWSKNPVNYRAWTKKYVERRAGGTNKSLNQAWKILLETAYAHKDAYYQGPAETVINARPGDSFNAASTWGHSSIYYDKKELDKALLLLVENYKEFAQSPAYKYDLADVAEQVLCNAAVEYHSLMVQAKNAGNLEEFTKLSTAFLGLIDLSDQILATTDGFLLGTWIEASRKMITGADDWTKDLFEFNARSLVTTWGGQRVSSLKDYSNRKWAGLTKDFYRERWAIWIRNRAAELKGTAKDPKDAAAEQNWFLWEFRWANRKSDDENGKYAFSTVPTDDDLGMLALQAFDKYSCTNLEKNTGGSAQETENVAEGKPVSVGASQTAEGNPANLTDGNTSTGWKAQDAGPHTMTIDLEETCEVSGVVISIDQLAKEFPYTWELEYLDPKSSNWVSLDTNKNNANQTMISTTEIAKPFTAIQIRLTVTTSDIIDSPVYVTEIAVNGVPAEGSGEDGEFENLALGLAPTANRGSSNDSSLAQLTDGNLGTLWKTAGNDYPVHVTVDLPQASYVDTVEVSFESEGRPFKFYATVTGENGEEKEISPEECKNHASVLEQKTYQMDVKDTISSVTVTLTGSTGQGNYYGSWPALAEIKVLGEKPQTEEEQVDLSDYPVSGISVSGGNAAGNVLDGNRDSFDKVDTNTDIVFDLGKTYYLSHVNLVFEKGELGLKYQVFAEDASGTRTTLSDQSESHETLGDRTVRVPVNGHANKIIFKHLGNNGSGPAYAAETRFYEFEAFGVEKAGDITANPQDASALLNGGADYTAAANEPIEFELTKMTDMNMVRVVRATDEAKALKYTVEYLDEESGSWQLFADRTGNGNAQASADLALAGKNVFAKKIRLTFEEETKLSEVDIYNTDYAGALLSRISQIEDILDRLEYGDEHGKYDLNAKEKAIAVLEEAKAAQGVNSQTVDEWLEKVNGALDDFYDTGIVYLDRDALLEIMVSAKELMEQYSLTGQDLTELQQVYEAARASYNTYATSQTALNTASTQSGGQLEALGIKIEKEKNPELAAERESFTEYLKELDEKDSEEYTAESWNQYMSALAAANMASSDWGTTAETMQSLKSRLETALAGLRKKGLIDVTGITVRAEGNKTSLKAGDTAQLYADVLPEEASDKSVAWSSENLAAATVDQDGKVTAKAAGTAVITATAKDGSGVSGKITLTVQALQTPPAKVLVSSVSLKAAKTTLAEGESVTVTATVTPANASDKGLAWASSDISVATVDQNGKVTAKSAGAAVITATAKDKSRKSGSVTFSILPKNGATYKDTKLVYKITASTETAKTVTVQKPVKASDKKITIPAAVTIGGYQYQVTAIAAKAFQKKSKLTQAVIGENVKTIGKQAFYNCRKLKTVTIKSKNITKIDKQAFGNIVKNAKITVPKAKYKAYKNLLQKKAKVAKMVKIAKAKK